MKIITDQFHKSYANISEVCSFEFVFLHYKYAIKIVFKVSAA